MNGSVRPGCKPGPGTVLTEEEEEQLAIYLIQMSEMGFGFSHDAVMHLAYNTVEKAKQKHPSKMRKQDVHGLMASINVTQDLPFVHHNLYRTAGHCA